MKRILPMLLILVLLFAGCKPEEPQYEPEPSAFETYLAGGTNGEFSPSNIKDPWAYSEKEGIMPQEKIIEVLGVQYTGKLLYTEIENYNSYITGYYKTEDLMRLGVDKESGNVVLLDRRSSKEHHNELLTLSDLDNAREYAIEKATEIASHWIDTTLYKQTMSQTEYSEMIGETECKWTNYKFTFYREINEFKTSDYMTVCICSRGVLRFVKLGDIGAFSDFENEDCTSEAVEVSIAATMEAVQKSAGRTEQSYEIIEHILAYTPEGECVVCSNLDVVYQNAKTGKQHTNTTRVITKFGERATE